MSQAVARAVATASLEITPRQMKQLPTVGRLLPVGTNVFVTCLAGADHSDTVATCAALADIGAKPIPHIAARSFTSWNHLEGFLNDLSEIRVKGGSDQAVYQALVIAGGLHEPLGPIKETSQVLRTGLLQEHGIVRIGFAGYPQGNPDVPDHDLRVALETKNQWVQDNEGVTGFLVSQFCFDPIAITDWLHELGQQGNCLPVQLGVAGPTKLDTLIKFAQWAGVGSSLKQLANRPIDLIRIAGSNPERLVGEIIDSIRRSELSSAEGRALGGDGGIGLGAVEGFHFYTFGGFRTTLQWAASVKGSQQEDQR